MNSFYTILLAIFHIYTSLGIQKSYTSHHLVVWELDPGHGTINPISSFNNLLNITLPTGMKVQRSQLLSL